MMHTFLVYILVLCCHQSVDTGFNVITFIVVRESSKTLNYDPLHKIKVGTVALTFKKEAPSCQRVFFLVE